MNTTKKEEFLLKQGRKQETIDFCKELKVPSQKFVWFCERIEKEKFNIKEEKFKEYIKKALKLLNRTNMYNQINSLEKLIRVADLNIETDEHENSRILHKFKNGNYIINLSAKELFLEGKEMSNCVADMSYDIINKKVAILALKDKKNKTLVHLQVNKFGFLEQHYSKANSAVNLEKWKYINDFFSTHKDEQFFEKVNSTKVDINYNVSHRSFNHIPIIEYFIPTKITNSILRPETLSVDEFYHIKDFVNTTTFDKKNKQKHLNKEELFDYLINFKNYINESIDKIFELIDVSHKNYFVLNDDIVYKIFNSKPLKVDEKISNIYNDYKQKMVIDYSTEAGDQIIDEREYEVGELNEEAYGLVEQIPNREEVAPIREIGEEEFYTLKNYEEKIEEKVDFVSHLKIDLTESEINSIENIINQTEQEEKFLTQTDEDDAGIHVNLGRNRLNRRFNRA